MRISRGFGGFAVAEVRCGAYENYQFSATGKDRGWSIWIRWAGTFNCSDNLVISVSWRSKFGRLYQLTNEEWKFVALARRPEDSDFLVGKLIGMIATREQEKWRE